MKKRKILEGVVTSDSSDKTIVVLVKQYTTHKVYKRSRIRRKKYKTHDQENKAKVGDKVRIVESRPFSKQKYFRLFEILK